MKRLSLIAFALCGVVLVFAVLAGLNKSPLADAETAQRRCWGAPSGPINENQAITRALFQKTNVPDAKVYTEPGGGRPKPGYANASYWRCVWDEEGVSAPRQMRLGGTKCWFPPTAPGNGDDHYGGCEANGRDVVLTEQVETGAGLCWFPPGVPSPDRNGSGYAKCLPRRSAVPGVLR